jgi:hypothetical protein
MRPDKWLGRLLAPPVLRRCALDLKDMAIERYPESRFARKYKCVRFAEETDYEALDSLPVFT